MASKQEQVFTVLARVIKKEPAQIKPADELAADLGIDSPQALQLLMELEEHFKLEISDEDAARMNTVKDIIDYVEKN